VRLDSASDASRDRPDIQADAAGDVPSPPCVPGPEACNGADDDCDGVTDEELESPGCRFQWGVCAGATQVCGGADGWLECSADRFSAHDPAYAMPEGRDHCDGLDNDCDGVTDDRCDCRDGETEPCGSDVGECRRGTRQCGRGSWEACSGVVAALERCDGRDNDCDGRTDEEEADLCERDHECMAGVCVRTRWVFEAESAANGHDVGRRDGDGWAASTADDPAGYLVFGPYTRDLPAGRYEAAFRLQVDDNSADNATVVRLEINDFDRTPGCGDCVIAERGVGRREFDAPRRYQDVVVPFAGPGQQHRLELRTYWTDRSWVRQDRVEVRRLF